MNLLYILFAVFWIGGIGIILVKLRDLILFIQSGFLKKIDDLTDGERQKFHDYIENIYGVEVANTLVPIKDPTPCLYIIDAKEVIAKYSNMKVNQI